MSGVVSDIMTRLRRDEEVTLAVLNKICVAFEVDIGNIMVFTRSEFKELNPLFWDILYAILTIRECFIGGGMWL